MDVDVRHLAHRSGQERGVAFLPRASVTSTVRSGVCATCPGPFPADHAPGPGRGCCGHAARPAGECLAGSTLEHPEVEQFPVRVAPSRLIHSTLIPPAKAD